jgi:hypothetical protein
MLKTFGQRWHKGSNSCWILRTTWRRSEIVKGGRLVNWPIGATRRDWGSPPKLMWYVFLNWAETMKVLLKAKMIPTGITPPEWTLRSLTQAHNRGMPDEQVVQIWQEQMEGHDTLPSYRDINGAVADSTSTSGRVALVKPKKVAREHDGQNGLKADEAFEICDDALGTIEHLITETVNNDPWRALDMSDRRQLEKDWRRSAEHFSQFLEKQD